MRTVWHSMTRTGSVPGSRRAGCLALLGALALGLAAPAAGAQTALLNVSYDPTRELYREIDEAFAKSWKAKTGEDVTVRASHGGSGAQARTVIDGVDADVVTLGIPSDIDAIAKLTKKIPADWRGKLPNESLPYTSTVVFLVRKGNPKGVKDWGDLVKPDVKVITPNPKTSAGGRWNFLAAWGYAYGQDKDTAKADAFVGQLYKNVPVLDTGARGSTVTFAQRRLGDVLPTWENEAYLVLQEFGADKFDIVVPPTSIYAEPPVALVSANAERKGTTKVAQAYLDYLYTDEAQAIFAKHHYRPFKAEAAKGAGLPDVKLFKIEDYQGSWDDIQAKNFDSDGLFDRLSRAGR
ncbi:sulfate transport system substrate-binding protein [Methylobacterium persicinum]|uniref:Sulfate transport system substrate-binding protein n=2 Tax=Methylobacterium persicinum TaxID=374426 RepID=A0ABU0HMZ0_9HYPH|nr:sulfate ABC transporter substrate-binding protein [Methylobacterium persicinum]MDQ0443050.1 sulfate transport system substrate-binding protein [Methylobacterium persicinum]GJE39033.1 Sulfate-binding protein [Methylobacterium persicinum]